MNIIALLPFYITLIIDASGSSADLPGLSFIFFLRIFRVLRAFRGARHTLTILSETMIRSARPLYLVFVLTIIALIVYSAVIFLIERGSWDTDLQLWRVVVGYTCKVCGGCLLRLRCLHFRRRGGRIGGYGPCSDPHGALTSDWPPRCELTSDRPPRCADL